MVECCEHETQCGQPFVILTIDFLFPPPPYLCFLYFALGLFEIVACERYLLGVVFRISELASIITDLDTVHLQNIAIFHSPTLWARHIETS